MKLPQFPVWGKVHLALSGGKTLCGTIERDKSLRVESGDYVDDISKFSSEKSSCKICCRLARSILNYIRVGETEIGNLDFQHLTTLNLNDIITKDVKIKKYEN